MDCFAALAMTGDDNLAVSHTAPARPFISTLRISALPKVAIARDLIRGKLRRGTDIPVVDFYINKPGLAAIALAMLMYKSTTRNSLIPVETWIGFAAIESDPREI